jgi:nitrate/nitrite transporter NarK
VVALLVRLDHGQSTAGAIGALTLVTTMGSRPLGGWVLHRFPAWIRRALAVSVVVGAGGCAGLAAAGDSLPLAVLCACAIGVGAGVSFAPLFAAAVRTRPDAPGAAIGVVNMWGNLAVLAATPLLGLAFSFPGGGRIGFLALSALSLAALLVLPSARRLGAEPAELGLPTGIRSAP